MVLRVWTEKIMLVRHVRGLGADTLAHQVYQEQRVNKWPGLARETAVICEKLGIQDCNTVNLENWTVKQYRRMITESCKVLDEKRIREASSLLSKCQRVSSEKYGRKDYMKYKTIFSVRQHFYSRFGMQPFAGNYKNSKQFQGSDLKCKCGLEIEEESHLMGGMCPVYGDLREEYPDLDDDDQIQGLFTAILERRARLEEEVRAGVGGNSTDIASLTGQANA